MREYLAQFNKLLPLAAEWAEKQEEIILENGQPLNKDLSAIATKIGVAHVEKIRTLLVPKIPLPDDPILKEACQETQLISPRTIGLTLNYGIFIRADCAPDTRLYIHELAHVVQYEKLGGILQFLKQYLYEVVTIGYPQAPMEQEAIRIADLYS